MQIRPQIRPLGFSLCTEVNQSNFSLPSSRQLAKIDAEFSLLTSDFDPVASSSDSLGCLRPSRPSSQVLELSSPFDATHLLRQY